MRRAIIGLAVLLGILAAPEARAQTHQHHDESADPQQLGRVLFPTSCAAEVQEDFNRAVAMLHSFWYAAAEKAFADIGERDPACALAHWGMAMTYYHPVWPDRPDVETLKKGWAAVEKAQAAGPKTPRERDFIAALEVFYKEADRIEHRTRVQAYEEAMEQLSQRYPHDSEAAVFYALSLLGTAYSSPPDKTYARQRKAGAILEKVFVEQPNHPGAAHYIIHSYDYPPLAERALPAARAYARIAPDSPHALHMPSHIFTRLGLWEESIASNLDSAASAHRHGIGGEELHAKDYLMYAYLQRAQDGEAKKLLDAFSENRAGTMLYFAGLYALAAMPARYVLERRDWSAAADLHIPAGVFPGGRYAWTEATFHLARGLGAVHTGDLARARDEVRQLVVLTEVLRREGENYWAEQVEIQRRTVVAWLALAEDRKTEALAGMRSAADLEDSTDKSPVTPGAVVPARELLGEMLLELKRPAEARHEFETTLQASPNRFRSLYGAARAAEAAGDSEEAGKYFAQLLELCEHAETERAELQQARDFLAAQRAQESNRR